MDTKSSKCVHLVEGGTNGPQRVNMAPMEKTSLGRVTHARRRQKTSFTNLETHGDGSGYLACDTCSGGVPKEIVPAGIVPIGNILVGNNIGVQTRTKGRAPYFVSRAATSTARARTRACMARMQPRRPLGRPNCVRVAPGTPLAAWDVPPILPALGAQLKPPVPATSLGVCAGRHRGVAVVGRRAYPLCL